MHDWFFRHGGRKRLIDWLGVDSWIDSSLAETWQAGARIAGTRITSFFARFRLTGWKRLANEAVSEGLDARRRRPRRDVRARHPGPAASSTKASILTGKYAVKFLDRNGNEIGKRGILHNDAVPLEEIPDPLIKATLATEDRRFFEHFGIDVFGTARALVTNVQANEVVQGGSSHHPAARQEPVPLLRALAASARSRRRSSRCCSRVALHQARDSEALPRPRLPRRRRLRRGGGLAVLLRQVGAPDQPGRGGHARRPVQGAVQVRPARQPAGLARAHQRCAQQPRRSRLHERRPGARRAHATRPRSSRRASPTAPTGSSTGPSRRCSASPRAAATTC